MWSRRDTPMIEAGEFSCEVGDVLVMVVMWWLVVVW